MTRATGRPPCPLFFICAILLLAECLAAPPSAHTFAAGPTYAPSAAVTTILDWGDNDHSQLGDGSIIPSTGSVSPLQVSGLSGVTAVAAGGYHSLALLSDGTVRAWGSNGNGQLGDGGPTTGVSNIPVSVNVISGVIAIAAGYDHNLALTSNGTVWAWGSNSYGQLGNGSYATSGCFCVTTPIQVSAITGVIAIAAGSYHSLALKSDGTVWAWGRDDSGQLGNGTTLSNNCFCATTPSQVTGLTSATAIAAGGYHSVALTSDGSVWTWGRDDAGQLGNGSSLSGGCYCLTTAIKVNGLSGATAVAAGLTHSVALRNDGTVWAWGANSFGQLGATNTGTCTVSGIGYACSTIPIQVNGLAGVSAIASGGDHTLALTSDSRLWAWGWNYYSQLGNVTSQLCYNNTPCDTTPVPVSDLAAVSLFSAGAYHNVVAGQEPVAPSPQLILYADQHTGTSSAPQQVTVSNNGSTTVNVGAVSLSGANPAEFTIASNSCTGAALSVGSSCAIGVSFAPAATGSRGAFLSIADDAATSPLFVPLGGNGTVPTANTATPTPTQPTNTPAPTQPTNTPAPTQAISTPMLTSTATPAPATSTPVPPSATPSDTAAPATDTPMATDTSTAMDTPTDTPTATDTAVPATTTSTPTNTAIPATSTPTDTALPATDTPTHTPVGVGQRPAPPSDTPTSTPTATPSATPSPAPTDVPTNTAAPSNPPASSGTGSGAGNNVTQQALVVPSPAPPSAAPQRPATGSGAVQVAVTAAPARPATVGRTRSSTHPQQPPLRASIVMARAVWSGAVLTIKVRTERRAHVRVTVQVTATQVRIVRKGKHRTRVTRSITLYRVERNGVADARGLFTAVLRISYRPRKSTSAGVMVTVTLGPRTMTRTMRVSIQPARSRHR